MRHQLCLATCAVALATAPAQAGPVLDEARAAVRAIAAHDAKINAIRALDPGWAAQARALDAARGPRSPVHGRTLLVKDNVETRGPLPTTAGSLALIDNVAATDAPLIARARAAGMLILGKTNLSEWANIRSNRSSSGWSTLGGQVRNPHALDRSPCGSSSGSGAAIAAGFAWGAIGTETDGSIVCPASINGIVGLKPTVGLVSRTGIVPISHTQDTAGPMTRSVRDAALLLGAIAGSDPADAATADADARRQDYTSGLNGSLTGLRVGAVRNASGRLPAVAAAYARALDVLRAAGAEVVMIDAPKPANGMGDAELTILLTELKADMAAYLARTPATVSVRSLADIIAFNKANAARAMPYFGQELFERAQETKGLADADYRKALVTARDTARTTLNATMREANVAIIVQPTNGPAWPIDTLYGDRFEPPSASWFPAMAGTPHLTVPMGRVRGLPIGLSFIGPAWSEALLLRAGDAYERRRGPFPAPRFAPRAED